MKKEAHKISDAILEEVLPVLDAEIEKQLEGAKAPSGSDLLKHQIDRVFVLAKSRKSLFELMEKAGLSIYNNKQGEPKGLFIDKNKKVSFKKLGLNTLRLQALDRLEIRTIRDRRRYPKQKKKRSFSAPLISLERVIEFGEQKVEDKLIKLEEKNQHSRDEI